MSEPVLITRRFTASHYDDEALAAVAWRKAVDDHFVLVHSRQPPTVEWKYPWGYVATGEATGEVIPHVSTQGPCC